MTDRLPIGSPELPSSHARPAAHAVKTPSRRRRSHPLLGVFPLAVMTLATFLIVFALMMARMQARADQALHSGGANALVESAASATSITTRASGAGTAVTVAASEGSPGTSPAIVTRSSSSTGGGASHDD